MRNESEEPLFVLASLGNITDDKYLLDDPTQSCLHN